MLLLCFRRCLRGHDASLPFQFKAERIKYRHDLDVLIENIYNNLVHPIWLDITSSMFLIVFDNPPSMFWAFKVGHENNKKTYTVISEPDTELPVVLFITAVYSIAIFRMKFYSYSIVAILWGASVVQDFFSQLCQCWLGYDSFDSQQSLKISFQIQIPQWCYEGRTIIIKKKNSRQNSKKQMSTRQKNRLNPWKCFGKKLSNWQV